LKRYLVVARLPSSGLLAPARTQVEEALIPDDTGGRRGRGGEGPSRLLINGTVTMVKRKKKNCK